MHKTICKIDKRRLENLNKYSKLVFLELRFCIILYMKLLAISDMHGNLDGISLNGIDVVFFAGDIAPLKGHCAWHIRDQMKWMNTTFKTWCEQWPSAEIVFIPGNHDFFPIANDMHKQTFAEHTIALSIASNAHMLIDNGIEVKGLKVYGTPWVPIISHSWAFEAANDFLKDKFNLIPDGLDVLLTHTPPRFNFLDVSLDYGADSEKFGSAALVETMLSKQPKMCFCGHIHSGSHEMSKIGTNQVWNVSRVNESYDIAYEPLVLDI